MKGNKDHITASKSSSQHGLLSVCAEATLVMKTLLTRPGLLQQCALSHQHCSPHSKASPLLCPCSQQAGLPLDSKEISNSKIKGGIISRQQTIEEHLTLSLLIATPPSSPCVLVHGGGQGWWVNTWPTPLKACPLAVSPGVKGLTQPSQSLKSNTEANSGKMTPYIVHTALITIPHCATLDTAPGKHIQKKFM